MAECFQKTSFSINIPLGGTQFLTHDELLTRAAMSSWLAAVTFWIVTDRNGERQTDSLSQTHWNANTEIYRDCTECFLSSLAPLVCSLLARNAWSGVHLLWPFLWLVFFAQTDRSSWRYTVYNLILFLLELPQISCFLTIPSCFYSLYAPLPFIFILHPFI